tara:strand:+ start:1220 stop:1468 length:249 start_codon:yes stop_codon:yes gene_type:complete
MTNNNTQTDQPFGKQDRLFRDDIDALLCSLEGMKKNMRALGEELERKATTDKETDAVYFLKKANFEMSESYLKEAYYDAPKA